MDNLSLAIFTSWKVSGGYGNGFRFNYPAPPSCPLGVAGMLRNGWPEWIGIPGRNGSEWVAGINRNQWPECVGVRNIRDKALKEALRNAVEHGNGVFIQAVTEVKNAITTRDEIISQSIGLARVVEKDFIPQFTSQGNYQVTCKVTANVPVMELVPE
jgi:hypothetical protein